MRELFMVVFEGSRNRTWDEHLIGIFDSMENAQDAIDMAVTDQETHHEMYEIHPVTINERN